MTTELTVDDAAHLVTELAEAIRRGKEAYIAVAVACWAIDETQAWTKAGYETKAEMLADRSIGMESSSFYRAVQVGALIKDMVDVPAIVEGRWRKILPLVRHDSSLLPKLLANAENMTGEDFEIACAELRHNQVKPDISCHIKQGEVLYDVDSEDAAGKVLSVSADSHYYTLKIRVSREYVRDWVKLRMATDVNKDDWSRP